MQTRFRWLLLLVTLLAVPARAHDARPAYLEINETSSGRFSVLWRTPVLSGMRLPVVLKLPDGVRDEKSPVVQELADSLVERRWIDAGAKGLAGRRIDFVGLQATITDVLVRVQTLAGGASTVLVTPSKPWLEIELSLPPSAVVGAYVRHGIQHIALGVDHLLFVLGLVLLASTGRMLLKIVVAFVLGSSLTLTLATLGYADPPAVPLNTAIALSTVFLGTEIIRRWRGNASFTIHHPWVTALLFGGLYGVGLARALTGIGLPRQDLPLALLSFNIGVEITEVGVVFLIVLLGNVFRTFTHRWPSWAPVLPAYAIGSLGAFWAIRSMLTVFGVSR